MEEEEAIIKINETNETRYLYKAETGYMNILQTSDHGKFDILCVLIFETTVRSLKIILWPQEVLEVIKLKMKKEKNILQHF